MQFNYGLEKKRFIEKWDRLEVEYREAGMSEENIRKMKAFDLREFRSRRTFCRHNQFYQGNSFANGDDIEEGKDPLLEKYFDSFTTEADYFEDRKYGWIELLDDEELVIAIKSMKPEYLDLIEKYAYEGRTMEMIGAESNVTKSAISNKIIRIRKIIKKNQK